MLLLLALATACSPVSCGPNPNALCYQEGTFHEGILDENGACYACGDVGQNCCKEGRCNGSAVICQNGFFAAGSCVACGGLYQPCCYTSCNAGLICQNYECAPRPDAGVDAPADAEPLDASPD